MAIKRHKRLIFYFRIMIFLEFVDIACRYTFCGINTTYVDSSNSR